MSGIIRKLREPDINKVAEIWLDTNIKAHAFISAQYWKAYSEAVKEMILQAEVYVYESQEQIQGFVGLNGDYIEGIFVCAEAQSHGIGRQLLDFVKEIKEHLTLRIYQKNVRALKFYQRENFQIQCEDLDDSTGEREYFMVWR